MTRFDVTATSIGDRVDVLNSIHRKECPRSDSNRHGQPPGGFKDRCVYRFRHGGIPTLLHQQKAVGTRTQPRRLTTDATVLARMWSHRYLTPDLVIAFPGGKGTADMVARAEKAGVPVQRVTG